MLSGRTHEGYFQYKKRVRFDEASMTAPQFVERLTSKEVKEGESIRFNVRVTGKPEPECKWFREGSIIISSPDFEISRQGNVHSLYIPEVFYEDSGKFSCVAENPAGQDTCTAELIVEAPSALEDSISPSPPTSPERQPVSYAPPPPPMPPQFTKPLANQSAHPGDRVVLECTINPFPEPEKVQWFKNEVEIPPYAPEYNITFRAGVCTLTINSASLSDQALFKCTVTVNGLSNSTSMELTITPAPAKAPVSPRMTEFAPSFTKQLADQPLHPGGTAYFECKVQGYPPPEILWTRRGHPLVDKARYKSTYDQYTGVTTLTILNCQPDDEGEYTCTAINSQGEASTSGSIQAPRRPTPVSPVVMQPAMMPAASPPPPFTGPFDLAAFEKKLRDEVEPLENGRIKRRPLNVDPAAMSDVPNPVPARIIQPLKPFQLIEGTDVTFVCQVAGNPAPSIQWYRNGKQLLHSNRYIFQTSPEGYASVRIRMAFPEDAGWFTVCATNVAGRDVNSAELYQEGAGGIDETSHVPPEALRLMMRSPRGARRGSDQAEAPERFFKPHFRKVPHDLEVNEGQMARFDCIVTGRPVPELTWYRDGTQVHDDALHKACVNEPGIYSLIIFATQTFDSGLYTCIARNKGGEDSFQVRLNVIPRVDAQPPRFIRRMPNQTVGEGSPVSFTVEATGVPVPFMSWQKDGRMVPPDDTHLRIETQGGVSSIHIDCADAADDAWFQCTASNVAGHATNRARLHVQAAPKTKEAPRPLHIPKRATPQRKAAGAPEDKRARPDEPARATASIQLTPTSPPVGVVPMDTSPAHAAPPRVQPVHTTPPQVQPVRPTGMEEPDAPPIPAYSGRPVRSAPPERPSTRDLIKQGLEPEPQEEDMYNKEHARPPRFKTHIQDQIHLVEMQPAHFECRLVPIGDPDMKVEWYKDGKLLRAGTRFRTTNDFGYVALDILWTYPEDNGVYMCHASNKVGEDSTQAELRCRGKRSIITETQLPEGMEAVQAIHDLEEAARRDRIPRERKEEPPMPGPPLIDIMPEAVICDEGDTAKFLCKVGGYPRPRLTWWVNGAIAVKGHRFWLNYDGHMHSLEIPKCREYDSGTIRVVAKNPHGEQECTTTLTVMPKEDWRSRLKQAPKSTVEIELDSRKTYRSERGLELDHALKKPKTTVVELRAFERSAQDRLKDYRDDEVKKAYYEMNLQHAQMKTPAASAQMRFHEPNVHIESEAHIERAKAMLDMLDGKAREEQLSRIQRIQTHAKEPPTFTGVLKPVAVKEGNSVRMEVTFAGFPTPEIQWFREKDLIVPSRDFQITTTATRSTLFIPEVFPEDGGVFTVKAINPYGMNECKAMLNVEESQDKEKESSPEFRAQMHDITIHIGEPATFDCQVTGNPKPQVYWAKDGKRLQDSPRWKFIIEGDHFTLLIYEVRAEDKGVYECVVVNKLGKATCSARLDVEGKAPAQPRLPTPPKEVKSPQLVKPMTDITVDEGNPATFQCHIVAKPDPVVQWFYNNQVVKPSKYFQMSSSNGVHTLTITGAFPEDEGVYKCIARNQAGEVTCIAHLKVNALSSEPETDLKAMEPPRFLRPIAGIDVLEGSSARFEAIVAGTPAPTVAWFREGHQISHSEDFQIQTDGSKHTLHIKEVFPEDTGIFTCRAANQVGAAECSGELFVEDVKHKSTAGISLSQPPKVTTVQVTPVQKKPTPKKPRIIKAPSPMRELYAGSNTTLSVEIEAYPPPRFHWYRNRKELKASQKFKQSYENNIITLVIYNAQPDDSGDYQLKATNDLGEVTCKTILHVKPTQKVIEIKQPMDVTVTSVTTKKETVTRQEIVPVFVQPLEPETRVEENSCATLSCRVAAYPPPAITWHVNGMEIKPSGKYNISLEDDRATLQVMSVTSQDTGVYTCRAVSDLGETVTSTTLYVTIKEIAGDPPRFVTPLKSLTATDGEEVILTCVVAGSPAPTISWFHNDKCIDKSEDFVITFNPQTGRCELVIVECLPDDQGVFKCVGTNPAGQAITKAELIVQAPSKVPKAPDAPDGDIVPEEVKRARMAPPPMAVPMDVDPQVQTKHIQINIQGQAVQEGVIEPMVVERRTSAEQVKRTSISSTGSGSSKEVKIIKKVVKKYSGEPPRFTKPIQPQVVKEGDTCTFTAIVTGAPEPEILWLKDKQEMKLPTDNVVPFFDKPTMTATLTIKIASMKDVGVYSCRAQNTAGRATCTANVVVVPPDAEVTVTEKTVSVKKEKVTMVGEQETRVVETSPQFTQPLQARTEVTEGETAVMECRMESEPPPTVTWYVNATELTPSPRLQVVTEQGRSRLTVVGCTPADQADYTCKATNTLGEAITKTTLIVHPKHKTPITAETVTAEHAPGAQAPPPGPGAPSTGPGDQPQVPPAPLTEPCAVIPVGPKGKPKEEVPKFTTPLRDSHVGDGDRTVFKVTFRGNPAPTITWFFNSQPIRPSPDFQVHTDTARGETVLVILEVFPEDEGEYMVRAENKLGAAVTHCHLWVKLPSSSSDEEVEKVVSKTVEVVRTEVPMTIAERAKFTETIAIDHRTKQLQEMRLQFALPEQQRRERSEVQLRQQASLKGMKMEVEVPQQKMVQTRHLMLKRPSVEAETTQRQEMLLNVPFRKERRFSETIAIDHTQTQEVSLAFTLPERKVEKSMVEVRQQAPLKGMRMEVEIQRQKETSRFDIIQKQRAEAVGTKRQELQLQLEGTPPRFTWELNSLKVMDGEEVKFKCLVIGHPMPEITWYKDDKVIVDNPDFRTSYNRKTGECILLIVEVFPQDTGIYKCVAVNKYGKAVTNATLEVEVYEYVADSEEASASQTESVASGHDKVPVSEDEIDFIERTEAFLAGMRSMRDDVPITDTEVEEIIEEVDMTELVEEETVQMADVMWQFGQRPQEDAPGVAESLEALGEYIPEQPRHEDIPDYEHAAVRKPEMETRVDLQMEQMLGDQAEDLVAVGAATNMQEEEYSVELAVPTVTAKHETRVEAVEEQISEDEAQEVSEAPTEIAQHQEIQVELAQSSIEAKKETRVEQIEERLSEEEVFEDISEEQTETTKGQDVPKPDLTLDIQKRKLQTHVRTQEAMMGAESLEELQDRAPSPVVTTSDDVFYEMMQAQAQQKPTTKVEHVEEVLSVGSVHETIASLKEEMMAEEEVRVDLSQPQVKTPAASHIGMTTEVVSEEEEEDIFYDVPEPAVEGEEIVVQLSQAEEAGKVASRVPMMEMVQEVGWTEEARAEFTTDKSISDEIKYDMIQARFTSPTRTLVVEQEARTEALQAQELVQESITEEKTKETEVPQATHVAERRASKATLVGLQEAKLEMQSAQEDVTGYSEDWALGAEVRVDLAGAEARERPVQQVGLAEEAVSPELVSEEYVNSIKEVYMIPSLVRPEYEPSVVERYRFESRVMQQTQQAEQTQESFLGVEEVAATQSEVLLDMADVEPTKRFRTQTQMVSTKLEAAEDQLAKQPELEIARQEVAPKVELKAAKMARQIVRAMQEVTAEQHVEEIQVEQVSKLTEVQIPEQALMAPMFEIPLHDVTVGDGERVTLECKVTGVPMPEVSWYLDGQAIRASSEVQMMMEEDGYCRLIIMDVLHEDDGEYTARAINQAGTCVSSAYLTVKSPERTPVGEPSIVMERTERYGAHGERIIEELKKVEIEVEMKSFKELSAKEVLIPSAPEAPKFTKQLENKEIFETMPLTLECRVTGHPEPEITWYQDGKKVINTQHMFAEYRAGRCMLKIDKVSINDEAEYMCEARNEAGVATTWSEVLVEKLVGAVEQVILEEFYEIEIELKFKWKVASEAFKMTALE